MCCVILIYYYRPASPCSQVTREVASRSFLAVSHEPGLSFVESRVLVFVLRLCFRLRCINRTIFRSTECRFRAITQCEFASNVLPQPVQPYMYIRTYIYLRISIYIEKQICVLRQMFARHWPAQAEAGRMRSICCCLDIGRPVASRTCNIPHSIFPHTIPHNAVRNRPQVGDVLWCVGGGGGG